MDRTYDEKNLLYFCKRASSSVFLLAILASYVECGIQQRRRRLDLDGHSGDICGDGRMDSS